MEITANFRAFFDALKFNRTVEDNSAIDAALLALVKGRKTLNQERVGRACRRVLHISYRMLDKASKRRDSMFELDNIHYKPAGKAAYKSAISSTAIKALSEALHTDESLTMPDNDRKGSTPVYWVDDQGVRMFDRHPNRVLLLGNRVELLDYLRGTTRSHCASLFVFEMAGLQPLLEITEAKRVELSDAFTRLVSSSMQAAGVTIKPKDCFSIIAVGGGAMAMSVRGLKKKQAEQGVAVIMANNGDGDGDRFSAPTDNAAPAPVDDAELVDPRDAAGTAAAVCAVPLPDISKLDDACGHTGGSCSIAVARKCNLVATAASFPPSTEDVAIRHLNDYLKGKVGQLLDGREKHPAAESFTKGLQELHHVPKCGSCCFTSMAAAFHRLLVATQGGAVVRWDPPDGSGGCDFELAAPTGADGRTGQAHQPVFVSFARYLRHRIADEMEQNKGKWEPILHAHCTDQFKGVWADMVAFARSASAYGGSVSMPVAAAILDCSIRLISVLGDGAVHESVFGNAELPGFALAYAGQVSGSNVDHYYPVGPAVRAAATRSEAGGAASQLDEIKFDSVKLTYYTTGAPIKDPHPAWVQFQLMTSTFKRPFGARGSTKTLRRAMCKCMRKQKPTICACPLCYKMAEWTRLMNKLPYHDKNRSSFHKKNPGAGCDECCDSCGGECNDGKSSMHTCYTSAEAAAFATMCAPVRRPEWELDERDPVTRRKTGNKVPFAIPPVECFFATHRNGCEEGCGINGVAPKSPTNTAEFAIPNGADGNTPLTRKVTCTARCCPRHFTSKLMTYSDWITIEFPVSLEAPGDDGDANWGTDLQKPKTIKKTQWLPKRGPMAHFLTEYQTQLIEWRKHLYERMVCRQMNLLKDDMFGEAMADGVTHLPDPRPEREEFKIPQPLTIVGDYSAGVEHPHPADLTCATKEMSHCNVLCISFNPRWITEADLETDREMKGARKSHGGKDGRSDWRRLAKTNIACFAYCEIKGDAQYHYASLHDVVYLLNHGRLKEGSKCQWFWKKQRVMGSCKDTFWPVCEHCNEVQCKESCNLGLRDATAPLDITECGEMFLELVSLLHDGCAGQHEGLHSYYNIQQFRCITGVAMDDSRCTSHHGKGISDAIGAISAGLVKAAVLEGLNYGPGTEACAWQSALVMSEPKRLGRKTAKHAFDGYLVGFYPGDRSGFGSAPRAEEGYKGSSKDHHRRPVGGSADEPMDAQLQVRERWCWCQTCKVLNLDPDLTCTDAYDHCTMRDECPVPRLVRLEPEQAGRVLARHQLSLSEFWEAVKPGEYVVFVSPPKSREPYWIGQVKRAPSQYVDQRYVSFKLDEAATYRGVEYNKGFLMVNVVWLTFVDDDERGIRYYRKDAASNMTITTAHSAAGPAYRFMQKDGAMTFTNRTTMLWALSYEAHRDITRFGGV